MNAIKATLIFVAGAGVGSVVTWYAVKTKYKKIADEEIASVKEVFSKRERKADPEKSPDETSEKTIQEEDHHMDDYKKIVEDSGYTNYSKRPERKDDAEYDLPSEDDNPFVSFINDDEYGYEFETESLDYYVSDDILVNEFGEVMEEDEVNEAIGVDWKDRVLNCNYDMLYIRNTYQEKDYEVVVNYDSWYKDEEE